jgi:KDO2-lipid IV(A) lauroyltransferase
VLFAVFRLLPIEWASALGGAVARQIGPFLGISKRARINLRRAFPELPEVEIKRIVAGMWNNLGRVAAEYPHLPEIRIFAPDGRVETHGFEHMDNAVAAGRRMILFSGHLITVTQIYRAPNNPLVDRLIARCRGDRGQYIPKGAPAARRAFSALYRGEHLTMLADQKLNEGIPVPFFGRPAMTATALALLALRFECDVLPARVERLHEARFRLTVFPPLPLPRTGNRRANVAALTATVTAVLESWIRDRPEEWLWVHRRWPD